jgi:hypothetical protein
MRPAIKWSGTMLCPVNTQLNYKVVRNPQDGSTPGIRNVYNITITYEILTQPATVSPGDPVTKTQMDNLRIWKNKGTEVTKHEVITATIGNTYKNNVTAGSSKLDDAWYNSII